MEELRIPRKEQFSNRLLKIIVKAVAAVFILFSTSVFAITPQEIQRITIKPEKKVLYLFLPDEWNILQMITRPEQE